MIELSPPMGLYSQLEDDATFYIYPTEHYNSLGFTAKLDKVDSETVKQTITAWESTFIDQAKALGKKHQKQLKAFDKKMGKVNDKYAKIYGF